MCHQFGVSGSPAIPAGFFSTNSDAFAGSVCLEGVPLGMPEYGDADTLIERTGDPFDRCTIPGPAVAVPIEIVALNLASVAPITVTESGGANPTDWNVAVDLSSIPSPQGTLTATKTHCNGGIYFNTLPVLPRFTFTQVGNPAEMRTLDTGVEGQAPIVLQLATPQDWVHEVDPYFGANVDPCTDFHPGIEDTVTTASCDCNGNSVRDVCDIENDPSIDVNPADGIPDVCQTTACGDNVPCNDLDVCTCDVCTGGFCQNTPRPTGRSGDVDCSGGSSTQLDDIIYVLNGFGAGNPGFYGSYPNADLAPLCTGNGQVNLDDIIAILNQFALGAGADPCCGP